MFLIYKVKTNFTCDSTVKQFHMKLKKRLSIICLRVLLVISCTESFLISFNLACVMCDYRWMDTEGLRKWHLQQLDRQCGNSRSKPNRTLTSSKPGAVKRVLGFLWEASLWARRNSRGRTLTTQQPGSDADTRTHPHPQNQHWQDISFWKAMYLRWLFVTCTLNTTCTREKNESLQTRKKIKIF